MTPGPLIQALSNRGIRLAVEGDGLLIQPASRLRPKDRALLLKRKSAVLAWLNGPRPVVCRADVEQCYPHRLPLSEGCAVLLADVLDHAQPATDHDPGDWPDLLHQPTLLAFARALLATGEIVPTAPAVERQPDRVTCQQCQHFQPNPHSPRQGIGQCAIHFPERQRALSSTRHPGGGYTARALWPAVERFCPGYLSKTPRSRHDHEPDL